MQFCDLGRDLAGQRVTKDEVGKLAAGVAQGRPRDSGIKMLLSHSQGTPFWPCLG